MKEMNLSKEVCEQLAQQLVKEQAELVKQDAVVNGLKDAIFRKKAEIIKDRIDGHFFKFDRLMYPLSISILYASYYMAVSICFGADPDEAIPIGVILTKREKDLFEGYKTSFNNFLDWERPEDGMEAWRKILELRQLKNGLNLGKYKNWLIRLSDATDPDFFTRTGLTLGGYQGISFKPTMLEDRIHRF